MSYYAFMVCPRTSKHMRAAANANRARVGAPGATPEHVAFIQPDPPRYVVPHVPKSASAVSIRPRRQPSAGGFTTLKPTIRRGQHPPLFP